jgi:TonB family protein
MALAEKYRFDPVVLALALSLLTHFIVLTAVRSFRHEARELSRVTDSVVEVEIQPRESARARQVVQTATVAPAQAPVKDAYLGLQTQQVLRETRAQAVDRFATVKKAAGPSASNKAANLQLGNLGVPVNLRPLGHLGPDAIAQQAATNDHLRDVQNGAQTLLNTREFAYYSFYQRVRRQLEQFWEPGLRERVTKMFRQGRTLATETELTTRLLVELDASGVIRKIRVQETTGLIDLDQAAVDAFNRAGPFPNPPQGMVEVDGTVKVEWEFVLRT